MKWITYHPISHASRSNSQMSQSQVNKDVPHWHYIPCPFQVRKLSAIQKYAVDPDHPIRMQRNELTCWKSVHAKNLFRHEDWVKESSSFFCKFICHSFGAHNIQSSIQISGVILSQTAINLKRKKKLSEQCLYYFSLSVTYKTTCASAVGSRHGRSGSSCCCSLGILDRSFGCSSSSHTRACNCKHN